MKTKITLLILLFILSGCSSHYYASRYNGDGNLLIQDYKLFGVIPILYYRIEMDEFDLGTDFEQTYNLQDLPEEFQPITIYLAVEECLPDNVKDNLDEELDIVLENRHGVKIITLRRKLKEMCAHNGNFYVAELVESDSFHTVWIKSSFCYSKKQEPYRLRIKYKAKGNLINKSGHILLRHVTKEICLWMPCITTDEYFSSKELKAK